MQPFRLEPLMPAAAYKTYQVAAPMSTHFVRASCAEVACPNYLNGWRVRVEILPPHLLHQARTSGRRFTEVHVAEGETWLVFEAGQACFQAGEHRRRLERAERFIIRDGDHRGNPLGTRPVEISDGSWVDDFGEHQEKLAEQAERG
jgi:hypothetical protein